MTDHPTIPVSLSQHPPIPTPWLWQCHLCKRIWKLSVTRRCLEDGHYFCNARHVGVVRDTGNTIRKQRLYQARKVYCKVQFDRTGWDMYNYWRREVADIKAHASRSAEFPDPVIVRKEDGEGGRNCWVYCDFPGECYTVQASSPSSPGTTAGRSPQDEGSEREGREILDIEDDDDGDDDDDDNAMDAAMASALELTIPFISLGAADDDDDDIAAHIRLHYMDVDF